MIKWLPSDHRKRPRMKPPCLPTIAPGRKKIPPGRSGRGKIEMKYRLNGPRVRLPPRLPDLSQCMSGTGTLNSGETLSGPERSPKTGAGRHSSAAPRVGRRLCELPVGNLSALPS